MQERAFASRDEWEAWLDANHADVDGVWLKFAKKGTGVPTVVYAEALDVALCYGWIDGQTKSVDRTYYLQKFTPRRARSKWSQINVEKVERLIASGAMRPAGLAEVERAKADGRWGAAYPPASKVEVPPELQAVLDAEPETAAYFESLRKVDRYSILYRLHDAKRPETKARRLEAFLTMLRNREPIR